MSEQDQVETISAFFAAVVDSFRAVNLVIPQDLRQKTREAICERGRGKVPAVDGFFAFASPLEVDGLSIAISILVSVEAKR